MSKLILPAAMLAVLLCPAEVLARDYGQRGTVFPVIERDLLEQIHSRLTQMERSGETARLLGLGRSGQDRALVRFKDLEPGRDVAGVMVEVGDRKTQFGPENGRGQLGDQFLGSIGIAAEAVLEIAIEPRRMPRPMRQLVGERCVVVVIGFEEFGRRHGEALIAE